MLQYKKGLQVDHQSEYFQNHHASISFFTEHIMKQSEDTGKK